MFVGWNYRVAHDWEVVAIEIAYNLQERNKGSKITLRDNGTGAIRTVLANGTSG